MKKSNKGEFDRARAYAFLLLKFRPRAKRELFLRLKRKKYSDEASEAVVSFLEEKGFVDDNSFCRGWISSRLGKPYGLRRLKNELLARGVDPGVIDGEIDKTRRAGYDESERLQELVLAKIDSLTEADPAKKKRRVYSFFIRRGFSPEKVAEAIGQASE